jgi:glycosyltransferase involved in cell wall biosynthesis
LFCELKILFINSSRVWGGNEKWTLRAAETLQARGHRVWMAIREPDIWTGHARTPVEQIVLPFLNDADLKTVFRLRRFIRRQDLDIVLPTRSRDYWLTGFARLGARARYVMRMGITRNLPNTFKERLRYGVFPDGIVVNAEAVKQSLARYPWVKAERIQVIYNGVDGAQSGEVLPPLKRDDEFLIVAAGRLDAEKGFDVLVHAAALAVKEIPSLRIIIFGQGGCTDLLQQQVTDLGLLGIVKLGGFTAKLPAALAQADLAVSSSHREGISNFILESWSAGVPVIATSIPGSVEIVTDGVRGRLVPPGDALAMAKAIVEAYAHPEQRAAWIAAGREAIKTTFNWSRMGESLESFLRDVSSRQLQRQRNS